MQKDINLSESKYVELFTIYDKVARESGPIYQAKSEDVAARQMISLLKKTDWPDDYVLYKLGRFDTHEMKFDIIEPKMVNMPKIEKKNE